MAVRKPDAGKTQKQKFIEAARKLGIEEDNDRAFQDALRKIINARGCHSCLSVDLRGRS